MKDIESSVYECKRCANISDDTICDRCKVKEKMFSTLIAVSVTLLFVGSIIRFM